MKKILSFALVLALVLASVATCFAVSFSDTEGKDYAVQAEVLAGLGVLNGYTDGTFGGDKNITRAEYVAIIVRALGFNPTAGTSGFNDAKGHWADAYIAYGKDLGIVNGYNATTFGPNDKVTYDQAIAFTVRALGYKDETLALSVSRALGLGMITGIPTGSAPATRGDVAKIVYNAASKEIGTCDKDGAWTANKIVAGVGTDNMFARLGGTVDTLVVTADTPSLINLVDYVGQNVKVLKNKDGKVTAIAGKVSTSYYGLFAVEGGVPVLYPNATTKYTITNTKNAEGAEIAKQYFVNGEKRDAAAVETAQAYFGYVTVEGTLTGTTLAAKSVSAWTPTQNYVVGALEAASKIKSIKDALPKTAANAVDTLKYTVVGVDSIDDIAAGNTVYVFKTSLGKVSKVAVGTKVVTGLVERLSSDKKTLTVEGTAYTAYTSQPAITPSATAKYNLYFDALGKLYSAAAVEAAPTATTYAVLVDDSAASETTFSPAKAMLKLQDGQVVTLDITAATTGTYKHADVITALTAIDNYSLVTYKLDADGKLAYIAEVGANYVEATSKVVSAKKTIDGYYIADNAVVFAVNGTVALASGEMNVTVDALTKVTPNTTGTIAAGDFDTNKIFYHVSGTTNKIDFIAYETKSIVDDTAVLGFYKGYSVTSATTNNYEYKFIVNGEEKVYAGGNIDALTTTDAITGGTAQLYVVNFYTAGTVQAAAKVVSGTTPVIGTTTGAKYAVLTNADNVAVYDAVNYVDKFTKISDSVVSLNGNKFSVATPQVYKYDSATYAYSVLTLDEALDLTAGRATLWDLDADGVAELIIVK